MLADVIIANAADDLSKDPQRREIVAEAMRQFNRMYAPHEAREDTVLFPAMRDVFSPKEYDELGDAFEAKEQELFGEGGFEKTVDKVAGIEKMLGIYDLSQFSPKTEA